MKNVCALLVGLLFTAYAQAALYDRGGGLIYDDDLNITWLQDAYYADTTGYGNGAQMTWHEAVAWAADLVYYDSVRGVVYTDWRLPSTPNFDASCDTFSGGVSSGYHCFGSELGHLFYDEMGGLSGYSLTRVSNANYPIFSNIQDHPYWSGSEYSPDSRTAWIFNMSAGYQRLDSKDDWNYNVWAVRDGDVAAIPEPNTWVLMLAGLGLIGLIVRRNAKGSHGR